MRPIDPLPQTAAETPATMQRRFGTHLKELNQLLTRARCSDRSGRELPIGALLDWAIATVAGVRRRGGKVIFIGNGGSAAISSHMAIDFLRNGDVAAMTFNDPASLTCLGNDFGYDQVFTRQIELHARAEDLLIAISSSGASPNILNAVASARSKGCRVLSLSGFAADNPLRQSGDMNLYIASSQYGQVEVAHLMFCHALLDLSGGWGQRTAAG